MGICSKYISDRLTKTNNIPIYLICCIIYLVLSISQQLKKSSLHDYLLDHRYCNYHVYIDSTVSVKRIYA